MTKFADPPGGKIFRSLRDDNSRDEYYIKIDSGYATDTLDGNTVGLLIRYWDGVESGVNAVKLEDGTPCEFEGDDPVVVVEVVRVEFTG